MSLTTSEMTPADFAAVTRNNNDGDFFGGNGAWWIIILFLFAFMGNGWGNNAGNAAGTAPMIAQYNAGCEVQRGFDQASVMNGISGISTGITNGFAGVNQALCSGFAGVNQGMANGFAQAEIAANARQMADMQQNFSSQLALMQQLNSMQAQQADCCCENRAATADLKYSLATEACADRNAIANGVRDIMQNQNAGIQTILDKMCQQELDAERRENANLRQQINMMNLAASQNDQTAQLLRDNAAQTQALEQYLNPTPVPAYQVQNPNCCCGNNFGGCGSF